MANNDIDIDIAPLLALDPSRELDTAIARLAGFEVEVDRYMDDEGQGMQEFVSYNVVLERNEKGWKKKTLPWYSASLDAAVTLPLPPGWEWQLYADGEKFYAQLFKHRNYADDEPVFEWIGKREDRALSYCRVWLQMKYNQINNMYPFHDVSARRKRAHAEPGRTESEG